MQCSTLLQPRLASPLRSLILKCFGGYNPRARIRDVRFEARLIPGRHLSLASIPTVLLPPVVFGGLLVTLWTYKCFMMIIFQNKIIYMPSLPPFSRSEKVEDYAYQCKPIIWTEHNIRSLDGTKLALLEGAVPRCEDVGVRKQVIVVYFQGNGSSLPPRLPYISNILKLLHQPDVDVQYTVVALSYRGFWKSRGRPSQKGIELDAQAALQWVSERYKHLIDVELVLWGQSIGVGVATTATATHMDNNMWIKPPKPSKRSAGLRVSGLLLETPFTSIRAMLIALYPQKILPYRYLGPFLMSTWDSESALLSIGKSLAMDRGQRQDVVWEERWPSMKVLLLEAGDDELVPKGDAAKLKTICEQSRVIDVEHKVVSGALHTDVMMKGQGKKVISQFLKQFGNS